MTLWQFNACVRGYRQRNLDLISMEVIGGYYNAYYNNTKNPDKPAQIVSKILKAPRVHNVSIASMSEEDFYKEIWLFEAREKTFRERGFDI